MKTSLALLLALLCGLNVSAQAAGKNKGKKKDGNGGRALAFFDRNHDGTIDAQESERVNKAFKALGALDTDHNGDLSGSELAAAKIPIGKKGGKNKAK